MSVAKTWIRFNRIFATCNNVPRRLHIESLKDHQTAITNIASDPHLGADGLEPTIDVTFRCVSIRDFVVAEHYYVWEKFSKIKIKDTFV